MPYVGECRYRGVKKRRKVTRSGFTRALTRRRRSRLPVTDGTAAVGDTADATATAAARMAAAAECQIRRLRKMMSTRRYGADGERTSADAMR